MGDKTFSDIMQKTLAAGDIVAMDDGYYYCWCGGGGLTASQLREIADGLDLLNAEWDKQIQREIGG